MTKFYENHSLLNINIRVKYTFTRTYYFSAGPRESFCFILFYGYVNLYIICVLGVGEITTPTTP